MQMPGPYSLSTLRVAVIGAGVAGLAAALRLRAKGYDVVLYERHVWPGGKMRAVPSDAGPVEAGPTVLTMRHVFDEIFVKTGANLNDYVKLIREPCLARHFWTDGGQLDLFDDRNMSARSITAFAGTKAARAFRKFAAEAETLFAAFDAPMIRSPEPRLAELARAALTHPRLLGMLAPQRTLARHLARRFADPRLQQLFARYATYVGGSPLQSPALLSLIWHVEEAGVWRVWGGMHRLAEALALRFVEIGGSLLLGTGVRQIETDGRRITAITRDNGSTDKVDAVVFAGDPRALALGMLGPDLSDIAAVARSRSRSLSARVWSFAAKPRGLKLLHHNVFFSQTPNAEFHALAARQTPTDPNIYICAQDRGNGTTPTKEIERFQIILNAVATDETGPDPEEAETCHRVTFQTLERFGLTFSPLPTAADLTTPTEFDSLFPGSGGALYGQTPHGMTAALQRPRARTRIAGLYLAGGGTHPGAGVPMAALSGKHAAQAVTMDLVST